MKALHTVPSCRFWLLGRAPFLAAVLVLLFNDAVAKSMWPGTVTGKVSDFAGVIVVCVMLAAVGLSPKMAAGLTAAAFTALKTLPGANVLAAPVLGGVTLRDPTDVIAIVALVPTAWWLTKQLAAPPTSNLHRRPLQLAGLVVAVFAVSATSAWDPPHVTGLYSTDDTIWVAVDADEPNDPDRLRWYQSNDGGHTFTETTPPPDTAAQATTSACSNGSCFDVSSGENVTDIDGRVLFEFSEFEDRLRSHQIDGLGYATLDTDGNAFSAVAAAEVNGGTHAVVSMGVDGVLYWDGETWERRAVGPVDPVALAVFGWPYTSFLYVAPALLAVVAALLAVSIRKRRLLTVALAGGFTVVGIMSAVGAVSFLTDRDALAEVGVSLAGVVVFVAVCVATERRTRPKVLVYANWPPPSRTDDSDVCN